jgi:hypothetical protein
MGNSQSFNGSGTDCLGGQLFVALKLHKLDGEPLPLNAVPHITGSMPIIGFWDLDKAVSSLSFCDSMVFFCFFTCKPCTLSFKTSYSQSVSTHLLVFDL